MPVLTSSQLQDEYAALELAVERWRWILSLHAALEPAREDFDEVRTAVRANHELARRSLVSQTNQQPTCITLGPGSSGY